MNQTVAELLGTLEKQSRKLPLEERQMFLEEVRGHLEADIRARMELGLGQEMAEDEAVAAFGDPVRTVRKLRDVHKPGYRVDRPFLVALFSFFAFFAFTLALNWTEILPDSAVPYFCAIMLLAGIPAVIVTAWRAKYFQWRAFAIAFIPVTLWFACVGAFSYAPDAEPPGIGTSYSSAQTWGQQTIAQAEEYEEKARVIDRYYARFESGENIAPRRGGGPSSLEMEAATSREAADAAWKKYFRKTAFVNSARMTRAEGERLLSLNRRDWWKGIPTYYVSTLVISAGWLIILAALSLVTSLARLGRDYLRDRSRDRRLPS